MKKTINFFTRPLLLCFITLTISVESYAQQIIDATIEFDGKTRAYRLYVPQSYDSTKAAPLILSYHGFTNDIDDQFNRSDFQSLAETNQFLFVTPQGLGNPSGWAINNFFGGREDDLGFSDALIDKIQEDYNINEKRIYATGYSNGGYFSYRLACELSPRIAAVASVAGSMTGVWINNDQCQPQHPTAVLQITGKNDELIPISGGILGKPIVEVMEYWAAYNNADSLPNEIDLGEESTRYTWDNGDNGVIAEFIAVGDKAHSWNGGNVNTSEEVWNFFSKFDVDGRIDLRCNTTIASFPYFESFERNFAAWGQSKTDDLDWVLNTKGTPSRGTGPSKAVDGRYYDLEVPGEGEGYPDKTGVLMSPCFDFSHLTSPRLQFSYHMSGNSVGELTVEANVGDDGNWTTVFNRSKKQRKGWNRANIPLDSMAGQSGVKFRIHAVSANSWQGDIAIDAFRIIDSSDDVGSDCLTSDFDGTSISFLNQTVDEGESVLTDENDFNVQMLPNPTDDQFSLYVHSSFHKRINLVVYNLFKEVKYEAELQSGINHFSAYHMGLSSGVYLIKVYTDNGQGAVKKLIIE